MLQAIGSNRGGLLIEVAILTVPVTLMVFVLLEGFRREIYQVLMAHITCREARGLALGESRFDTEKGTKEFLEDSLGAKLGHQLWKTIRTQRFRVEDPQQLRWLKLGKFPGGLVEHWLRYEQLISFELRNQTKHHQEIVKRCLFPFS